MYATAYSERQTVLARLCLLPALYATAYSERQTVLARLCLLPALYATAYSERQTVLARLFTACSVHYIQPTVRGRQC
jgi:hypothetical protein